jgi:hypothetical protein
MKHIQELKLDCVINPDNPRSYREFSKYHLDNAEILFKNVYRLVVMKRMITACAILAYHQRGRGTHQQLHDTQVSLSVHISSLDFPIGAIDAIGRVLSSCFRSDKKIEDAFSHFLLAAARKTDSQKSIDRIFAAIGIVEFSNQQVLSIINIAIKAKDPRCIGLCLDLFKQMKAKTTSGSMNNLILARTYLWAIVQIEGPRHLKHRVTECGDRIIHDVYQKDFKGLYLFSVGKIDDGVDASLSISPECGLVFNGARLFPSMSLARGIVADVQPDHSLPEKLTSAKNVALVLSCNPLYLQAFGTRFVQKLHPPSEASLELVILVDGHPSAQIIRDIERASAVPVRFSVYDTTVTDKAFFTLRRFLSLPEIATDHDLVIVTDIDAELNLDDQCFLDRLVRRSGGWHDTGNGLPWLRNSADFVYFTRSRCGDWAARCLSKLGAVLYESRPTSENWFCDQVYLAVLNELIPPARRSEFVLLTDEDLAPHFDQISRRSKMRRLGRHDGGDPETWRIV